MTRNREHSRTLARLRPDSVRAGWLHVVRSLRQRLSGVPSPRAKARVVIDHADRHGIHTLIETGTYHGAMVASCLPHFDRIYTIELDQKLYEAARLTFAAKPNVTVIHGDSYTELSKLCGVDGPVLFWLDAHHSGEQTAKGPHDPPLQWELRAIASREMADVILIDDARLMGAADGYPSLDEIRGIVGARAIRFDVQRDIVRIRLASTVTSRAPP